MFIFNLHKNCVIPDQNQTLICQSQFTWIYIFIYAFFLILATWGQQNNLLVEGMFCSSWPTLEKIVRIRTTQTPWKHAYLQSINTPKARCFWKTALCIGQMLLVWKLGLNDKWRYRAHSEEKRLSMFWEFKRMLLSLLQSDKNSKVTELMPEKGWRLLEVTQSANHNH